MNNKKNPLYVVTNKGQDVEECNNLLETLIKKFNLTPLINLIQEVLKMILEQVNSYPALVFFNEFMQKINLALSRFAIYILKYK